MKLSRYALIALTIPGTCYPNYRVKEALQFSGAACGLIYLLLEGRALAHELGHALTAKALWGCPIDITLGASSSEELTSKPLLTFAGIKIQSFKNVWDGFASFKVEPNKPDVAKLSWLAILAAGPGAEFVFCTSSLLALNKYCAAHTQQPQIPPHWIIAYSVFVSFTPKIAIAALQPQGDSDFARMYRILSTGRE